MGAQSEEALVERMVAVDEEQLSAALSKVLLSDDVDVDGLDEDLVEYIAGMLSSKVAEDEGDSDATPESAVDEVMVPFLESVACPDEIVASAKEAIVQLLESSKGLGDTASTMATSIAGPTRKLSQGLVNMASDLSGGAVAADVEASRFHWGTDSGVKPSANALVDAHTDKTSAKEKRKRRQEMESQRRALEAANAEEDNAPESLVSMSTAAFRKRDSKANNQRDVQCRNVTVSLDNGTILLDAGEIKFAYQRRYGLIGENGVVCAVFLLFSSAILFVFFAQCSSYSFCEAFILTFEPLLSFVLRTKRKPSIKKHYETTINYYRAHP